MGEPGDLRDGVFLIVQNIGKQYILLVKHNYGEKLWSLPGGGVRQGEIVTQAARREAEEEVNIHEIGNLRQIGQFTLIKRYGLVILFEATNWRGVLQVDGKEISELSFFTHDEIREMKETEQIYRAQFKLVDIFRQYHNQPRPIYGKLTDPPTIEFE